ncbi:hypothetical protein AOC05_14295 [Arthrobacter alpinus]|uniref:HutD family protein n=1 Tax=Arthrobacter alpinus TaxID=656366 RepID=A0A0M4QY66_9MICC|nr:MULTISPECIES: HutD family protein [Arthrobacter]ALE93223.1 hypothetical protein AOC05_14295 [Arthrobacter alpinus]
MDIIKYASLKAAPWANGGGITRQLASGSADRMTLGSGDKVSNAEPWDWRISIAEVAKAGPFSPMPGMDRILTIIDGELIALTVDGAEHALEKYRTFRFSGDLETSASLPTGALMDLNVMTRRGSFKGYATILELSKKRPHPVFAGQFAVLLQGSATVSVDDGGTPVPLGKLDTVVGTEDAPEISGRGFLAVVSIDRAED